MGENNKNRCPELESTLMLYLYDEAPDPQSFEEHLAGCNQCAEELVRYRSVLEQYRDLPPGADYVDMSEAMSLVSVQPGWSGIEGFLRPALAFGVALLIIVAFILSMRFSAPVSENTVTQKIEEPLDNIEEILKEIFMDEEYSNDDENEDMEYLEEFEELDGIVTELEDIYTSLSTF